MYEQQQINSVHIINNIYLIIERQKFEGCWVIITAKIFAKKRG